MIVPSNSTSIFSLHGGDQSLDDARVDVPNELNVVTELGTPHTFFAPSATRTPNGSFGTYATLYKNNSAGTSSTTLCILSKGVWRLRLHCTFGANYTDATGLYAVVRLNDLLGGIICYLTQFPVVAGAYSTDSVRMLMLTEDLMLQINAPGNGATQINSFAVSVTGERVL